MKNRLTVYWLAGVLFVVGIGLTLLRHTYMEIPLFPRRHVEVWTVEARVDFRAVGNPVRARLSIPSASPGFRTFQEQAASPGYGFSIVEKDGNRMAEWTKAEAAGRQILYYKVQIQPYSDSDADTSLSFDALEKVREAQPIYKAPEKAAAEAIVAAAMAVSSTRESLARELIRMMNQRENNQHAALLLSNWPIETIVPWLLTTAGVENHVYWGLFLEDKRRNQSLSPLLGILTEDKTTEFFDLQTGRQGIPADFFIWYCDRQFLLDLMGGGAGDVSFSMNSQRIAALEMAKIQSNTKPFAFLSMHHLPIEQQTVFTLLLLLPVGTLVVAFMRMIVGVRTSGTFMPILIAMSFLQTSLVSGLLYFIGIVVMGLLLRGYLSRVNLLLVARISVIAIIVILMMALFSLIMTRLGFHTGIQAISFPVIILSWTIERMSILWEEEGMQEVMIQGGGSLVVAIFSYLIMSQSVVRHLTFNFPELSLSLAAIIILIGHYTGYRLFELKRFSALLNKEE